MSSEKRYQIFVSSTFLDLKEERQAVQKAILELGHMPAGMELFPASDDSAWDLIKSVINESDYYILIIGGKYGSLHPEGVGFTEMEYDYAYEQKKPVIALLHGKPDAIPRGKTETDEAQWRRLEKFREKVRPRHTCQFWENAHDLKASVIVSVTSEIKRRPAIGWLRGNTVPSGARIEDVLVLKERVAELETQLKTSATMPAPGSEGLSQGSDENEFLVKIETNEYVWDPYPLLMSWDDIFASIGPALFNEASDLVVRNAIKKSIVSEAKQIWQQDDKIKALEKRGYLRSTLQDAAIDTCIVQLRAVGLIVESMRKRSVTDSGRYWALTPFGDNKLNQLRAIRR